MVVLISNSYDGISRKTCAVKSILLEVQYEESRRSLARYRHGTLPRRLRAEARSLAEAAKPADAKPADKKIVLGFSQIGAESDWRAANTENIKAVCAEVGIDLKFADAQQKQENQIKAIRGFIAQGVDVILLARLWRPAGKKC